MEESRRRVPRGLRQGGRSLQTLPRQRPHLRPPEGRRGARQALRLAARHHQGLRQVPHRRDRTARRAAAEGHQELQNHHPRELHEGERPHRQHAARPPAVRAPAEPPRAAHRGQPAEGEERRGAPAHRPAQRGAHGAGARRAESCPRRERCGLRRRGDVHQRLRAAQPRPRGSRCPREADAGRPRILPPLRDARPAPHTRRRAGRRGTRAARRAGGIAVQSCPAPLQGQETMLQKRFAMVRGRFAMLQMRFAVVRGHFAAVQCPMQWCETDLHDCKRVLQWCEAKLHRNRKFSPPCGQ